MVHFRLIFYLQFLEGKFSHFLYLFMLHHDRLDGLFSLVMCSWLFLLFYCELICSRVVCVCVCVLGCESVPTSYSPLVSVSTLRTQRSWTSIDVHFLPCSSHTIQDTVNADTLPRFTVWVATLISFPLKGSGQGWASSSLSFQFPHFSLTWDGGSFPAHMWFLEPLLFRVSCCTQLTTCLEAYIPGF